MTRAAGRPATSEPPVIRAYAPQDPAGTLQPLSLTLRGDPLSPPLPLPTPRPPGAAVLGGVGQSGWGPRPGRRGRARTVRAAGQARRKTARYTGSPRDSTDASRSVCRRAGGGGGGDDDA